MKQFESLRSPDGGPIYAETNLDKVIAEPFNGLTASLFFLIAVYWLKRLWKSRQEHQFLFACLWILAIGGIGGTAYHAFRSSSIFFLMDVLPISVLCLAVSGYLWNQTLNSWMILIAVMAGFFLAHRLIFILVAGHIAISAAYALFALWILIPLFLHLKQHQFSELRSVIYASVLFLLGLAFRVIDPISANYLPTGTHWLWHLFSAFAVSLLIRYLYRTQTQITSNR